MCWRHAGKAGNICRPVVCSLSTKWVKNCCKTWLFITCLCLCQECGVLIFMGLWRWLQRLKRIATSTPPPALKIPRLRLWVKVRHWLLNLCDCDSVLSERRRQTNSQDLKNNTGNPILLRYYLNLISCSKTWFGLLCTIHYFIIFCKIVKIGTTYAESYFLAGFKKINLKIG